MRTCGLVYKTVKFVPDIVVRAADIPSVETFEDVVTEYLKSGVKLLLFSAFRLHKPKVDLEIKGDDTNQVFASVDYPIGQMKLVSFPKPVFVIVDGKGKNSSASVEIKLAGPKSSSKYVAIVSAMSFGKIDRGLKKPLNDTIVAPYWLVRRVLDKSMANMQNTTMACPLTTEPGDKKAIQHVNVTIMQNIKALKEGDELLLYVEPSVPTTIMPAQTLGHVARKRPAATIRTAAARMQKNPEKR